MNYLEVSGTTLQLHIGLNKGLIQKHKNLQLQVIKH